MYLNFQRSQQWGVQYYQRTQNQPKYQILFYENCSPRDLCIITLNGSEPFSCQLEPKSDPHVRRLKNEREAKQIPWVYYLSVTSIWFGATNTEYLGRCSFVFGLIFLQNQKLLTTFTFFFLHNYVNSQWGKALHFLSNASDWYGYSKGE